MAKTEAEWLANIEARLNDAANGTFGRQDGKRLLRMYRRVCAERDVWARAALGMKDDEPFEQADHERGDGASGGGE